MGRALRDNEPTRWTAGEIRALQEEAEQLRAALEQAYQCCARPPGVCFDPALIDGEVAP